MTADLFDLSGKRALVTGSSKGLGRAMARALGKAGATVVLNGRAENNLRGAMSMLRSEGVSCECIAFDVTDPFAVEQGVATVERSVGPIDILVNNAGMNIRGPLVDYSVADWRTLLETNVMGAFHVSRAVGKAMIGRHHGRIINTCSISSEVARQSNTPYSATKSALKALTRGLAVEWAKHNILVNAISPGWFQTDMTESLKKDPDFDRWVRTNTPMGRWGDPSELGGVIVFLASEASSFITGQVICVDGGWLSLF